MDKLFSISECAAFCNITPRTLRYYDELGIVKPRHINEETGYRYYGYEEMDQLNFVAMLKRLNIPLSEIKESIHKMNISNYLSVVERYSQQLDREMSELRREKAKIEKRRLEIGNALEHTPGTCAIKKTEPTRVLFFPDNSRNRAESYELRHNIAASLGLKLTPSDMPKVLRPESLFSGEYVKPSGYYIRVDDDYAGPVPAGGELRILPSSLAAYCVSFVKNRQVGDIMRRLIDFIYENGYEICGDGLQEILLERGVLSGVQQSLERFVIPIRKRVN